MRRMSSLCRSLGASALRPSARLARGPNTRRPFVAVARVSKQTFDTTNHPVGFPPMPAAGGNGGMGGRMEGSVSRTNAYANDYAPSGTSTAPPPTVDWDARNVNSVVVIGNVGMQPEITEFGNGACVARCTLAVRGKKKVADMDGGFADDGDAGAAVDDASQTTWLDVEAWNDDARTLMEHVSKGKQLQVTGRLKENTWVDKQSGQKRSRVKIAAYAFAFIAPYNGGGGGGASYGNGGVQDPYVTQSQQPPAQQQYQQQARQSAPVQSQAAYDPYAQQGGAPAQTNYSPQATQQAGGEKDDLWRDVLENPSQWWDNRAQKAEPGGNPRYPDFKHKENQTPLWIESRDTPGWAADGLNGNVGGVAAMGAAAATPQTQFDPYYSDQSGADASPSNYAPADYSQPYGEQPVVNAGYEPAAPFGEEDEPPF